MQEKKNKQLLISLIVLTAITVALIFFYQRDSTFQVDKKTYHTKDLNRVNKVVLQSSKGDVELDLQGNRWKVNNVHNADRNLIEVLFATLDQTEAKRPVSGSVKDSVSSELEKSGVRVSLYSDDELLRSFIAGGNANKSQAFFMDTKEKTPHVVVIPGYRVYVSGIFEVPSVQWKEKLIFDLNWRNFKGMEARFRNPQGNFEVGVERNEVVIQGVAQADTAKLNTYLDQLSLLTVETYLEPEALPAGLSKADPLATFLVKDIGERIYSLKVFAFENQFFGQIHGDQWAILNERRIVPLLRSKEFFLKR